MFLEKNNFLLELTMTLKSYLYTLLLFSLFRYYLVIIICKAAYAR
jgi:hypothetical protein